MLLGSYLNTQMSEMSESQEYCISVILPDFSFRLLKSLVTFQKKLISFLACN